MSASDAEPSLRLLMAHLPPACSQFVSSTSCIVSQPCADAGYGPSAATPSFLPKTGDFPQVGLEPESPSDPHVVQEAPRRALAASAGLWAAWSRACAWELLGLPLLQAWPQTPPPPPQPRPCASVRVASRQPESWAGWAAPVAMLLAALWAACLGARDPLFPNLSTFLFCAEAPRLLRLGAAVSRQGSAAFPAPPARVLSRRAQPHRGHPCSKTAI